MSANKVCKRCVEWSKIGLSDTCPDCDRADNVPQKPKYHSKSEMKRIECMKEDKPDATPREWWIVRHSNGRRVHARSFEEMNTPQEMRLAHVIEKSYADALKQRVAELEQDHKDDMRESQKPKYHKELEERVNAMEDYASLQRRVQDDFKAREQKLVAALGYYADKRKWHQFISGGNIGSAQDGDFAMAFDDGEDSPWVIAARAIEAHKGGGKDQIIKHTDRIAELEGQLKAKVSLETVFVADSYENELAGANARIAELEKDNLLALDIANKFANERDELKEREQKLVACLERIAARKLPENESGLDPNSSLSLSIFASEALAEHKGGG